MLFYRGEKSFSARSTRIPGDYGFPFMGKHDKHLYSRRIYNRKSSGPHLYAMQENLGSFRFNANVVKPNSNIHNKPGKYSNNSA
jgi:hypothetical protein